MKFKKAGRRRKRQQKRMAAKGRSGKKVVSKKQFKRAKKGKVRVGGHDVRAGAQAAKAWRQAAKQAVGARGRKRARNKAQAAMGSSAAKIKMNIRGKRQVRAADVDVDQSAQISELEANLADLRQTVDESQTNEAVHLASNELLEGLKAVYDASTEWYERIADEVKEDENLSEDDARVAMGRHLEQIAEDASRVAGFVVEGECDIEDAADDLESLGADLEDALEAMKGID